MNILKKLVTLSLLVLCTFFAHAQEASNVRVSTTDKDLIVTYDLLGKPNTIYDLKLTFKDEKGGIIIPKTIKGDHGEVTPGKDKVVIWKVYEDINGLEGKIEPLFDIKEKVIKKPQADQPTVQDTPTPKKPKDPVKVDDVIDKVINRGHVKKDRFGVKASFGNSGVISNNRSNAWTRDFSWEAGLFYRYNINRKLFIQPELLYHKKKYSEDLNETIDKKYNHDVIKGQVIGGVKPIGLGLYFNAGLYYAYQVGGHVETIENGSATQVRFNEAETLNGESDPFNKTDFGYILGGTLSFNKGSLALGVLFSQSFDNVLNNDYYSGSADYENLSLQNRTVHFVIQKRIKGKSRRW